MILLLGGSGYVGSAFRRQLEQQDISYQNLRRVDADFTQPTILTALLRDLRPEFLINCAGFTGKPNVDVCEQHKTECLFANAVLPGYIQCACEQTQTPWGHISTGCIYNGASPSNTGYSETDSPSFTFRQNNCSFYSGTKALGEELLAGASDCYIWRLRMPFEETDHPRNFLTKLMRYERLLDARNSLSHLQESVTAAIACWQKRVPFGTYNIVNPGSITTKEIVELIRIAGVARKNFQFFKDENEFNQLATKTPRSNCVLDTTKLQHTGIIMTEVHEAVESALRNWTPA